MKPHKKRASHASTSLLEDPLSALSDDDLEKPWEHFKDVDGSLHRDVSELEKNVKKDESDTSKVVQELKQRHEKFRQEQADMEEKARSAERKAGLKNSSPAASFVEAGGKAFKG